APDNRGAGRRLARRPGVATRARARPPDPSAGWRWAPGRRTTGVGPGSVGQPVRGERVQRRPQLQPALVERPTDDRAATAERPDAAEVVEGGDPGRRDDVTPAHRHEAGEPAEVGALECPV